MSNGTVWISKALAFVFAWLALGGCQAQGQTSRASPREWKTLSLAIVGYNYTNRYINTFEVDGAGGGNLFVSSPTSGGGGTTCCALYMPGLPGLKLTIRWQDAGCIYHTKSTTSNEVFEHIYHTYKEAEVPVEDLGGLQPRYLEVHFYPDGTVQAAATQQESPPRLKLPKQREDRDPYQLCPGDKSPAE